MRAPRLTSLLQVGRRATPLDASDLLALPLLWLAAFSFRWDLRNVAPYIAETWHFHVARNLWSSDLPNVIDLAGHDLGLSWFFWQRPMLTLPFWPLAQHSFAAYRAGHIALASAVPALAYALLRGLGVRRLPALAAAIVLCLHPLLLPWGTMFLPDSLLLLLLLGALLAAHQGRPALTFTLLWAASWVKEIAFVATLSLLALALWRDADGRPASLRPLRLGPFARWLLPALPLAFLPLVVSLALPGGLFPGFRGGGDLRDILERVFLLLWLAPLALLGLVGERSRRFTLVALAWPAFFLAYHLVLDKFLEFWYYVVPATMTLLAATVAVDGWRPTRPGHRLAVPVGLVVLGLVMVQVFVPPEHPVNQAATTPLTGDGQWSLEHLVAFEHQRDAGLAPLLALPDADERAVWLVADFEVSFLYYPLADQADLVYAVNSGPPLDATALAAWQDAVEHGSNVTLLVVRDDHPGNLATRLAYAECSTTHWPFVLIRARQCQGAGDDLWTQYQAVVAQAT